MKKRVNPCLLLLVIVCLSLFAAACNSSVETSAVESSKEKTLKISLALTPEHPMYKSTLYFIDLVQEKTKGLNFEVYHSGQLINNEIGAYNMLQNGDLAITITATGPLTNFKPEFGVFDLPFMFSNYEEADAVLDGPFGDKMRKLMEDQDIIALAFWDNGFRNLTNSIRPVDSLEDVNGLKIRVLQSDVSVNTWSALGANPTPMSWGEVFTALQQGAIDAQENPYTIIDLGRIYEVQKYITETNHVYSPMVFSFSKPIWDELSAEQQKAIADSAYEARLHNRKLLREQSETSLKKLNEHMEFTQISTEELEKFRKAVEPVIEQQKGKIGEDVINEFMEAIKQAKK